MYKIDEKGLQTILEFINKYTTTGLGLPLLKLIESNITKLECNCSDKIEKKEISKEDVNSK